MQKLEAVLFDMDGVIVDSNPIHKEVLIEFCRKYGVELDEENLRENVYGRTNKDWIPNVFGEVSDETIEAYTKEKEEMFREVFIPKDHIVPGLIEFLELLDHAGIRKVIATSAPAENADYILKELDIASHFDAVLNASHVSKSKPDPEPYLKAAKAGDAEPQNCIVFEDSISGVRSGSAAGAKVVGVATTHTHQELQACDLIVDDFTGLNVEMLEDLFLLPQK